MQQGYFGSAAVAEEQGLVSVVESVERDLARWEKRRPGVGGSALAAIVLRLAARVDDPDTSATAASYCANAMNTLLERIESSLPPEETSDSLDELRARRAKRRAG